MAARPDRRTQILDAALDAFAAGGLATMTIDEILRRSGASTGSLYHHFGCKEDLAGALYVAGLRSYQETAIRTLERHPDAEEGVRAYVANYVRWIESNPRWARYLLEMRGTESVVAMEPDIREINDRFFGALRHWLESHIRAGRIVKLAPELYAAIITGPLHEWARQHLAGRAQAGPRTAARALGDAAWRALAVR